MNFSHDSTNDSDITKFNSLDDNILIKFREFSNKFKLEGDFVDLSKLNSLECEICNEKFINETKASEHAREYSHWQFKQI